MARRKRNSRDGSDASQWEDQRQNDFWAKHNAEVAEARARVEAESTSKPDGTAFKEHSKTLEPEKTDIWFNRGKEDGGMHGHVTQSQDSDGNRNYHFVRDNSGRKYLDDRE